MLLRRPAPALLGLILLAGCQEGGDRAAGPQSAPDLRDRLAAAGVVPVDPPPPPPNELVELGRVLSFDPILSGNKNIACATCHHPSYHSTDYLSLSVGEGGHLLGPARFQGTGRLIPRNAADLYNRGLPQWNTLFWDGRVERRQGRIVTPAGSALPPGVASPLAAQAMFPVLDRDEMRGHPGDLTTTGEVNELAAIADQDVQDIWDGIMRRVLAIPEYRARFALAFPSVDSADLGFEHAARAIAAFETAIYTQVNSPFDRFLRGDDDALDSLALSGATLFYGRARCATCHAGPLLSDQRFHNIGVPQLGPGQQGTAPLDQGRSDVTGAPGDRFAFRTPPLRNVALTGPWMHNGAYTSLRAAVAHFRDPAAAATTYDPHQLLAQLRNQVHQDPTTIALVNASLDSALHPVTLSESEIDALVAFLVALTDPRALDQSKEAPSRVPSGLRFLQ